MHVKYILKFRLKKLYSMLMFKILEFTLKEEMDHECTHFVFTNCNTQSIIMYSEPLYLFYFKSTYNHFIYLFLKHKNENKCHSLETTKQY